MAWDGATCILFGDGTGAMVLTAQQGQCSLLGLDAHSDGGGQKHLNIGIAGFGAGLTWAGVIITWQ
ncbi:hypothetical protein WJX79_008649 [Trebouxia sp. C0005]